jgi:competence protein ComEC
MVFRSYPTLRFLIFLVIGILLSASLHWSLAVICAGLSLVIGLGILSVFIKKFYPLRHLLPVSFFFLGLLTSCLYDERNHSSHLSKFFQIEGTMVEISSYTETKEKTFKAVAKVRGVYSNKGWKSATGKVILYFNQQAGVFPKYGEMYVLNDNLREIEGPKNPYEFNYKAYLEKQNIFYHQFLREGDFKKVGISGHKGIYYYANLANEYTHEVFRQVLDDQNQLGVAEAMIGGMRSELNEETLDWYTKTGTVHALAVSGMHIAILFWVLNAVFGLFLNRRKLPFIVCVLSLLWAYAVFTGLSASVCRSTLMFSIFQIGIFIHRNGNSVNTLLFSALVLLLVVPTWIYDVGFQLSYLAVLGILVLYPWLSNWFDIKNRIVKWTWDVTAVSIAAQVYTLPLSLYYFHQFPNYSLLANPIVSVICLPLLPVGLLVLFLFKVPLLGVGLGWIFKWLIIIMNKSVYWIFQLPFSVSEGLSLSVFAVILLFFTIGVFQYYLKSRRILYLQIFFMALVLFFTVGTLKRIKQSENQEITFHYIPNGYGVSLVKGRTATFISSDSLLHEPKIKQYHLKNYYNKNGIQTVIKKTVLEKGAELITSNVGSVFWIKENGVSEVLDANYTLISNNALHEDAVPLGSKIILDGTNHKWYIDKIKNVRPDAIVLYETGSQTFQTVL